MAGHLHDYKTAGGVACEIGTGIFLGRGVWQVLGVGEERIWNREHESRIADPGPSGGEMI
jgi:hypothetical protein